MSLVRTASVAVLLIAVSVAGSAETFYVPGVAQAKGAGVRYWNTELWISNTSNDTAIYAITFLPAGRDNSSRMHDQGGRFELAPGETHHLSDAVPPDSKGALKIVASDGVVISCRVFNATATGSLGYSVPVMTVDRMVPPRTVATLTPLLRSPRFRSNVGLFNPNLDPIVIHVSVLDDRGEQVGGADYTVEAGSQAQINDFLIAFRVERADAHRIEVRSNAAFAAYATIVETRTGSPMLISPVVP